jgi:hypothetical protein
MLAEVADKKCRLTERQGIFAGSSQYLILEL